MNAGRFRPRLPSLPLWLVLGSGLVALAVMLLSAPAHLAQTRDTAIVVDTLEDELNDRGRDCSLREAIQAASTDSPVDGCPAGDGDDAILLPAGRYLLTLAGANEDLNQTGDLDILTGTVILMGPGPERTVIDGNHSDRVLHVHAGAVVKIHGLQITNGDTGADELTSHSQTVRSAATRRAMAAERAAMPALVAALLALGA